MSGDPAGLYERLDLDPTAPAEAIVAAYRRKARVLHPDVAGTGDAAEFIRVKEAYDVLSDAVRRAAYDRSARVAEAEVEVVYTPPVPEPVTRGPRFSDLPIPLWAALGGLFCLAAVMVVLQVNRPAPTLPSAPVVRPFAPSLPANTPRLPNVLPPPAAPAGGPTNHYVRPAGGDAVLWRHDATHDAYLPAGHLAAFTPVLGLRLVPEHGLMEIRLKDGGSGFIDVARLEPGDAGAARRGYCAYNAGAPPRNGEVLDQRGGGAATLDISNRSGEPAVVKLRDISGQAAATVFVSSGARARVTNLPEGVYRPDYAVGELWSRACNTFAAGMRAQRLAGYSSPASLSPLTIPPDLSVAPAPEDIPDAAFNQE